METWAFYKLASVSTARFAHSKEPETSVKINEWQGGSTASGGERRLKAFPVSNNKVTGVCYDFLKWDWASLTFCNPP